MALDTAVDSNVLSYPVLVSMKVQGAVTRRGGASPQPSGEVEPALGDRVRRSQPLAIGRGRVLPSRVERGGTNLPSFGHEAQ